MTEKPNGSRKSRRTARKKYLIRKWCQGHTQAARRQGKRGILPKRKPAESQMRAPQDAGEQLLAEIFSAVQYEVVTVTPSRHEVRYEGEVRSWHRTLEKAEEMRDRYHADLVEVS